MSSVFADMSNLNRLIHEPARLSILTALSVCQRADFTFLQRLTGLSVGNLSSHLAKLEEGGLVQLEKQFVDKRPNTLVRITDQGRQMIDQHWQQLEAMRKKAQEWKPGENDSK